MKKIMMVLALALTVTTSFAFTGEEAISRQALTTFKNEFSGATNTAWSVGHNYFKVTFTLNDQQLIAYYNNQGEFIAMTRFISSFQLPLNLQKSLRKSFKTSWVTDLFEVANDEGTTYYVTLKTADTTIVLRSVDGSNWSVYQKSNQA